MEEGGHIKVVRARADVLLRVQFFACRGRGVRPALAARPSRQTFGVVRSLLIAHRPVHARANAFVDRASAHDPLHASMRWTSFGVSIGNGGVLWVAATTGPDTLGLVRCAEFWSWWWWARMKVADCVIRRRRRRWGRRWPVRTTYARRQQDTHD